MIDQGRSSDLVVHGLWADSVEREEVGMRAREDRLLYFATTLQPKMLQTSSHRDWATRLKWLADAIPDTHGLLIKRVCSEF